MAISYFWTVRPSFTNMTAPRRYTQAVVTYTVTDGTDVDTTKVDITVAPVNDPPVAATDTAGVDEGGTLSLEASDLSDNDSDVENDALSITAVGDAVIRYCLARWDDHHATHMTAQRRTIGRFSYTVTDGTDPS